jgi:hypothetical protein
MELEENAWESKLEDSYGNDPATSGNLYLDVSYFRIRKVFS